MKRTGFPLVLLAMALLAFSYALVGHQTVRAQAEAPLILVMTADGPIEPAMQDYLRRGIQTAEQRNAEALIIQLDTPGGGLETMKGIISDIRGSSVPVIIYVTPRGAWAASAGALVTMAAHASAMAPETTIGASIPIDSSGGDLQHDLRTKEVNMLQDTIHPFVEPRGQAATRLAESMIEEGKTATETEALNAKLIDFVAVDLNDLLKKLDGFSLRLAAGDRTLRTSNAVTESLDMSLIEELLLILTDSNIAFLLLNLGMLAIMIELTHPGAWVPAFTGVVCLALAFYGIGRLPVNWFGLLFMATAFVLFVLDIKAPTHGALTSAGVASLIIGSLVLFNSPGVPQFQHVSVPLVIGVGISIGLLFAAILTYALRAQRNPVQTGAQAYIGKTGFAKTDFGLTGQVQVESELWTAEPIPGSQAISKGDRIEVVEVKGLRLKVKKL
jgi:membrane-bound serine protease (ClpP class)